MNKFKLIKADKNDSRFFWELANDTVVRESSFSSDEIPWDIHTKWFEERLSESSTLLLIAKNESGQKIGQLRFEEKEEGYVISVSLAKEFRGKGLGVELIRAGSEKCFITFPDVEEINAYIKHNNISSIRSFQKAGYKLAGFATVKEKDDASLMVLKK